LNGVIALILHFSPNSIDLLAQYVVTVVEYQIKSNQIWTYDDWTMIEYGLIMPVNIVSQFQSSTFGHS